MRVTGWTCYALTHQLAILKYQEKDEDELVPSLSPQ